MAATDVFDLDAYLERIGLDGRPTVEQVHRAHAIAIPFENLDPRRGVPASLHVSDLQRKLVTERRGGYCFEHNLLLGEALTALGCEIELMLARPRMRNPALNALPAIRPLTHCALRVTDADGVVWHADVGFGLGTPLRPLSWGPGEVHEFDGWRYRVVSDGDEFVLQDEAGGAWRDLYVMDPRPVLRVDYETSNWLASTYPRHPMVRGLIISANSPDGSRVAMSDWSGALLLTEQRPGAEPVVTALTIDEARAALADRFGLDAALLDGYGMAAAH